MSEFDEYIVHGEANQKEKAATWQTAIALQDVDGLKVSPYLHDTVLQHIEGDINALSYQELQEPTNLLTNIASENVIPNVLIEVENTPVTSGAIVVATVPEGKNKPIRITDNDQASSNTDPVQVKTDPVSDQATQNTTKLR